MRMQEVWKEWLALHIPSIRAIEGGYNALVQAAVGKVKLERVEFDSTQQKILAILSVLENTEYLHAIENPTLLNTADTQNEYG